MNNLVLIAAVECEHAAKDLGEGASLEDRARAAMLAAKDHWMATREEDQFMAVCEGLARVATPEEVERIKDDLERLQRVAGVLNALQAGVPVDFDKLEVPEPTENPLGLRKMWQEITA